MFLQLPPQRSVQVHPELGCTVALEADQRLHVEGHLPAQSEQPDHRFYNKRKKLQDRRDFGPTTPLSAARYQASTNYPGKIEWTSVLNNKMFLDVLYGYWGNFFPLRPTAEVGIYDGPFGPGRQDLANNQFFDGGGNSSYQDQKRYKPQFYTSLSYFKDGWAGSHDFKFGFDISRTSATCSRTSRSTFLSRPERRGEPVDIYNTPVSPVNGWTTRHVDERHVEAERSRHGELRRRLENYEDGWPEQQFSPTAARFAGWNDATYQAFIAPRTISAQTVAKSTTFSPPAGMAYNLTDDNRTVLKATSVSSGSIQPTRLPTTEPGWARAAALSLQRSERQPPARRPQE